MGRILAWQAARPEAFGRLAKPPEGIRIAQAAHSSHTTSA